MVNACASYGIFPSLCGANEVDLGESFWGKRGFFPCDGLREGTSLREVVCGPRVDRCHVLLLKELGESVSVVPLLAGFLEKVLLTFSEDSRS